MIPVKNLIPLQELDLKIDAANASIEEKKQKILKMQKEIDSDLELVNKKKALLKKIQLRKRAAENDLAAINDEIKTSELKLKSAGLSPSSYAALEKELASKKKRQGDLETSILEDMEKIEILEKDTTKGEKVLAGRKKHLEEIKARVADEIKDLRKEIDLLKTEKQQISLKIDSEQLEMYEQLRNRKKGQVIYDTEVASCPACGMGLPGSFVSAVSNHDEAEKCSYCDVLIHWTGQRD
ncbi:MAG: hypothetical protein Kow0029_06530 [Candidatus Rifleibacteriota bacterium]